VPGAGTLVPIGVLFTVEFVIALVVTPTALSAVWAIVPPVTVGVVIVALLIVPSVHVPVVNVEPCTALAVIVPLLNVDVWIAALDMSVVTLSSMSSKMMSATVTGVNPALVTTRS
jgi:hypothetical protein